MRRDPEHHRARRRAARTQRGGRGKTEAGSNDGHYAAKRFRSQEKATRAQPATRAEGNTPAQGVAEDGARTVHDVIAALQAEATDFKDKWLRAHAEIENIRKRAEREKEETAKYAVTRAGPRHRQRRGQFPARHRRGSC